MSSSSDENDSSNDLSGDDSSAPPTVPEEVEPGMEQAALPDLSVDGVVRAGDLPLDGSPNTDESEFRLGGSGPDGPPSIADQVKSLADERTTMDLTHAQQAENLIKESLPSVVLQLVNIATGKIGQDAKLQADVSKYLLDRGLGRAVPANADASKAGLAELVEDLYNAQPVTEPTQA